MKLALIKPLMAFIASIVMCMVFVLTLPAKSDHQILGEQCEKTILTE